MSTGRKRSPRRGRPRRGRTTRWIGWGLTAAVVAAGVGLALSRAPGGDVAVSGTVTLGGPAPDITMTDFEGERFELSDFEGKPLVVTYRLAADPQGEIFNAFGGAGMPTMVFIDASGTVVDVVVGQLSKETLTEYVERSFPDHDVG